MFSFLIKMNIRHSFLLNTLGMKHKLVFSGEQKEMAKNRDFFSLSNKVYKPQSLL